MSVRFTPTGRAQFLAALYAICRKNPLAVARFRQRVVLEFPDLPYREVIVSPYRFFYRM